MGKANKTRAALLRAAVKVIGRHGYSGATVDEIAEEAGVSKGNVYYHFKTKGDIATSVLVTGVENLVGQFKSAAQDATSGADALLRMINTFTDVVFRNPSFARFMLAELWREDREWSQAMRQLEDEAMLLIQEQIERGQKEGALRQTFDSRFAAVAIMGTVLTSAQYYLIEKENLTPQEKSKQFSTHVVDYISHALGV